MIYNYKEIKDKPILYDLVSGLYSTGYPVKEENFKYEYGSGLTGKDLSEAKLNITKEEAIELMTKFRLAGGVMPLLPKEYYNDAEFMQQISDAYNGETKDKKQHNPMVYKFLSDELKNDSEFITNLLSRYGSIIATNGIVGEELANNEEFVVSLLNNTNLQFDNLFAGLFKNGSKLLDNKSVMSNCALRDPDLYQCVVKQNPEYAKDKDFVLSTLSSKIRYSTLDNFVAFLNSVDVEDMGEYSKDILKLKKLAQKKEKIEQRNDNFVNLIRNQLLGYKMMAILDEIEDKHLAQIIREQIVGIDVMQG